MNSSSCSKNILFSKGSKKEYFGMDLIPSTDLHSNLMNPEEEPSKILEEDGLRNVSIICPMEFEDFTSELNLVPRLPGQDFDCAFTSMDLGNNSEPQEQEDTMMLQYEEIGSLEMANSSPCPTSPTVSDSLVQRTAEKNLEVVHMTNGEGDQIVYKSKTFEEFPHDSVVEELSQVPADKEEGNESLPSLDGNHSENHHEETFSSGPSGHDDGNHEDCDDSKSRGKSQTREQPKRLAKPKNLRDSITIVGASTSKPNDSRTKRKSTEKKASSWSRAKSRESVRIGEKGRKTQPKPQSAQPLIDFNGTLISIEEFERLPTYKRFEIEEVDSPFFDRKKLFFHTKWKYYPDNHEDKYNDEWAENVWRFRGGVQAVKTFLKKFKVNTEDKNFYDKVKNEWKVIRRKKEKKNEELMLRPSNTQEESSGERRISKSPQENLTEPEKIVIERQQIVTGPSEIVTEPQKIVTKPQKIVTEPQKIVTEPQKIVTEPHQETETESQKLKSKLKSQDELNDSQKRKSLKRVSDQTTVEDHSSSKSSNKIKRLKKNKASSKHHSGELENSTENSKVATSSRSTTRNGIESASDDEFHLHLREENSSNESWLMSSRTKRVANVLDENEGDQDETDDEIGNSVGPINTDSTAANKKAILEICNERPLQIKIPRVDTEKKTNPAPLPVVQTTPEVNPVVSEPPANPTSAESSTSTSRGRNYEKHKRYEQRKFELLSPEEYRIYKSNKRKKMRTRQKLKRQKRQELIKTVRAQLIEGLRNFRNFLGNLETAQSSPTN